jgi:TM2 domain-containing membrane protein YozV
MIIDENRNAVAADQYRGSSTTPNSTHPRNRLTDSQKMLIEQRITNDKPSTGTAYLLCFFLGALGVHRLYLGEKGTGIVMLILGITFFGLIITGPWAFIDLFLIPSIIRKRVEDTRQRMLIEAMA